MDYSRYLPVDPDYYDTINSLVESGLPFRVIYFNPDQTLGDVNGDYSRLDKGASGEYLVLKNREPVRIDRIIALCGKPGPAFDEYIDFADACLSCKAGYEE